MATKPTPPKPPAQGGAKAGGSAKPAAGGAPSLSVVGGDEADSVAKGKSASGLRLKELVDLVVAATGGKKKGVKEIVEATLAQMGSALQRGETLNLPSFGKLRVARAGAEGGGAMTLKLRQATAATGRAKSDKDPIADPEDQD